MKIPKMEYTVSDQEKEESRPHRDRRNLRIAGCVDTVIAAHRRNVGWRAMNPAQQDDFFDTGIQAVHG